MGWSRGQLIGQGSTATVWTAIGDDSDETFAVKSAELGQSEFLRREQRILSDLNNCLGRSRNIVAYKGCDISSENGKQMYNFFMEYAPRGSISDEIRRRGRPLGEGEIRSCIKGILQGLDFLHSNGLVHCDIKGQNVLFAEEGVKIADFGCARRADDVVSPLAGSPAFMAPEVARGYAQGFPADVWAVGCTAIEMATGRPAWSDAADPISALYRIGFSGEVPEIPRFLSKQGRDFLGQCFKRDQSERWSVKELLHHPFLDESLINPRKESNSKAPSPISVIDRGFWSETEEPEPEETMNYANWVQGIRSSSADPPRERIRRLSDGIAPELFNGMPEWEMDGQWLTVRTTTADTTPSSEYLDFDICFDPCNNCSVRGRSGRESSSSTSDSGSTSSSSRDQGFKPEYYSTFMSSIPKSYAALAVVVTKDVNKNDAGLRELRAASPNSRSPVN